MPNKWRLFASLLLFLSCTSCVSNVAYRTDCPVVARGFSLGTASSNFDLAYLEFDDMGEFWTIGDLRDFGGNVSVSGLAQVLALISERKTTSDVVVITFIHGWHNNASEYDERPGSGKSLAGFESIMQELSADDPQHVYIGVFVAWRGEVIRRDPILTNRNRRDAAVRIGGPSLSEAVFRMMFATKEATGLATVSDSKTDQPELGRSRFIIIGHSFGGRI